MKIEEIFYEEGIKNIVMVPDSLLSKCINCHNLKSFGMDFIQVLNESDAVCICSGLNLTGAYSVCMIENSGIRSACDIISRFELAHGIHNIFILSNRGEIGEENWWGIHHNDVTNKILEYTNMKTISVKTLKEFKQAMQKAMKTFKTGQTSVAILLEYTFFEEIV